MHFHARVVTTFLFVLTLQVSAAAQKQDLAATAKTLQDFECGTTNSCTDLPTQIQQHLKALKHGVRDLVTETLAVEKTAAKPEVIQARIVDNLKARGIEVLSDDTRDALAESWPEKPPFRIYGRVLRLLVQQPTGHPDLLAVVTTLSIPYGDDSSLYIYERRTEEWYLRFETESNDYASILGAKTGFQYLISPPDARGSWFVVTADVNPWPTSSWQQLRLNVFRQDALSPSARKLFQGTRSVYLGVDDPFGLELAPNGFIMRFHGWAGGDVIEKEYREYGEVKSRHVKMHRVQAKAIR